MDESVPRLKAFRVLLVCGWCIEVESVRLVI